jgi:hypothetical protein
MRFKLGELVKCKTEAAYPIGLCIVIRKPNHFGPYMLWSTKKQTKVYLYEKHLSPISTGSLK